MKIIKLLVILLLLLNSCKDKANKIHPIKENITESVYASGIVKSLNQYQVFSLANGIVKEVLKKEGDSVKQGEAIFTLSNDAAQLNIEQAKITADYSTLAANAPKLNELQVQINLAKANLANQESLLQKQTNLWSKGIGTKNDLDQRELAYKNAKANYNAANIRYVDFKKQLNQQADISNKNLQISKNINSDFTIRSKINGKVYKTMKEVGEMVNMQTPVALIGDADSFLLALQVDEYDISKVKLGQKVLVTMDSYKGNVYEAQVSKIYPIMDERSRSFQIEAIFTKRPPELFPNLTCEANIIIEVKNSIITIPRNYLLDDNYVLLSNKEKRKVITGLKDYQKVEIISGLSTEDYIILPENE